MEEKEEAGRRMRIREVEEEERGRTVDAEGEEFGVRLECLSESLSTLVTDLII